MSLPRPRSCEFPRIVEEAFVQRRSDASDGSRASDAEHLYLMLDTSSQTALRRLAIAQLWIALEHQLRMDASAHIHQTKPNEPAMRCKEGVQLPGHLGGTQVLRGVIPGSDLISFSDQSSDSGS